MMLHAQRFALDYIYCAPAQDRQYAFKLVRVTKRDAPIRSFVNVYGVRKHLPNSTDSFHVYTIGGLPADLVNLLTQRHAWFRDSWIQASEDMVQRNLIVQLYCEQGVQCPRAWIYYSFIDQNSLMICVRQPEQARRSFDFGSFEYLHLYSNAYFQSQRYRQLSQQIGIDYRLSQVANNLEKTQLQAFVSQRKAAGGDALVFVNGFYTPQLTLTIPDGSFVEVLYDQSISACERYVISELTTFGSRLDTRVKRLIYRTHQEPRIQYHDDVSLYVCSTAQSLNRGLYVYQHQAHTLRNVTDKDFSVDSALLNQMQMHLTQRTGASAAPRELVLYIRHSGRDMPLVYSALKLHELYKLPAQVQRDVINNTGYTLSSFRAETLEESAYFAIARAPKMSSVTAQLATRALGYSALSYYYAYTPVHRTDTQALQVPELYQWNATALEYDTQGRYTQMAPTDGPLYQPLSDATRSVEFLQGRVQTHAPALLHSTGVYTLRDAHQEVVVLSAYFDGQQKLSHWSELASSAVQRLGTQLSIDVPVGQKVCVVELDSPRLYDLQLPLSDGVLHFPLTYWQERGVGMQEHLYDYFAQDVSVYLNGYFLTQGIDYQLRWPYVTITSKKYLRYHQPTQNVHLRVSGYTEREDRINEGTVGGFVHHGVLTRNGRYDVREDRTYSVFMDGRMLRREDVYYSEEDAVVRTTHPHNGLPYCIKEHFKPLRFLTGEDTRVLYEENLQANDRISALFNQVYPEASVPAFNVIGQKHELYSPVLSKLIHDVVEATVERSLYTNPYNDSTVVQLLQQRYAALLAIDPVKLDLPEAIVEIHPHVGNAVITLDLFQYRFITNVVRILTNNRPERVNLSGYLALEHTS